MNLGVKLASATDVGARHFAARRFHRSRLQAAALPLYKEALALEPANSQIREEESYCLAQMGRLDEAVAVAKEGLRLNPADPALLRFLSFAGTASIPSTSIVVASNR
jgi:tetratricopeptide (TPR) repeat protein